MIYHLACCLSADHKVILLSSRGPERTAEATVGDVRPAG